METRRTWLGRAGLLLFATGAGTSCVRLPGPGPGPTPPQPAVARLTATVPNVEVLRAGSRVGYAPGMALYRGDRITTPGGTSAAIDFFDGNEVYLSDNTQVEIGTIRLFFGEIYNLVVRIAAGGSTVYTNDLAAAAESTGFLVNRRDPGRTIVTVVEGVVRCSPQRGAVWRPISVSAGFQLVATGRARAERPAPVNARAAAQWVDGVAQRLRRKPVLPPPPAPVIR